MEIMLVEMKHTPNLFIKERAINLDGQIPGKEA